MQFSTLLTLTLAAAVSATPYRGQYPNSTLEAIEPTYVTPPAKGTGILNSTVPYPSSGAAHPSSTGAPLPSIVPFTGAAVQGRGASLALLVAAVAVAGWV
jgi:hypothetical protein